MAYQDKLINNVNITEQFIFLNIESVSYIENETEKYVSYRICDRLI